MVRITSKTATIPQPKYVSQSNDPVFGMLTGAGGAGGGGCFTARRSSVLESYQLYRPHSLRPTLASSMLRSSSAIAAPAATATIIQAAKQKRRLRSNASARLRAAFENAIKLSVLGKCI